MRSRTFICTTLIEGVFPARLCVLELFIISAFNLMIYLVVLLNDQRNRTRAGEIHAEKSPSLPEVKGQPAMRLQLSVLRIAVNASIGHPEECVGRISERRHSFRNKCLPI